MGRRREFVEYIESFWGRVDKSGDCWLWTGEVNNKGYGGIVTGFRIVVFNILFGLFIAAWVLYPWLGVPAALGVIGWGYRHA